MKDRVGPILRNMPEFEHNKQLNPGKTMNDLISYGHFELLGESPLARSFFK